MADATKIENKLYPRTVGFEYFVNLLGNVMYTCLECGDALDDGIVDVHAIGKHQGKYIALINVPIGDEKEITQQTTVEEETPNNE